ncbi:MAG: protein-L-isoaspartate O-methyltransferase [Planctomycetes bacterium RBG_13_63_9]|nr:MAG: protein-L-isoaspartate O-methyltransferase [Planctomycetes bacterium RBG_13_63_9]
MIERRRLRWALVGAAFAVLLGPSDSRAQGRDTFEQARNGMVDEEIVAAGVKNQRVIQAIRDVPRHEFIPLAQREYAYYDMALPIGHSQTISPPFIVALMTEALDPQPGDKVLEIGTGSGYQAAILSGLVRDVYTIEIVPELGRRAARTLTRLRYNNVHAKVGDGYQGWPEHAPFDKIIVTCSPESVPRPLIDQLKEGGRMVVPVGERYQQTLYLLKKVDGKMVAESLEPTLFVPMTGRAEANRQELPDPAHPAIENGDFEQTHGDPPLPIGWHYQRQLKLISDGTAPVGKNFVTFANAQPGRGCHALQGLALDGREVSQIEISLHVAGRDIRPGQNPRQLPVVLVTFFDEGRTMLSRAAVGPWRGTFPWQSETRRINVPPRAREALVRIGMFGGLGEISYDDIQLKAIGK